MSLHLSALHYRFFCDKLVQSVLPRFLQEVYRCRHINQYGAAQLRVDTQCLKVGDGKFVMAMCVL